MARMDTLLSSPLPLHAQVFQGGGLSQGMIIAGGVSGVSPLTLPLLILKAIQIIISTLALLTTVSIVICGILYIISIGNEETARKAKMGILYSVIGLLVILFAKAMVTFILVIGTVCGNTIVEFGEQCDGGACCASTCTYTPATIVCRASAGICDLTEKCTGSSATCPSDVLEPSTTVCRASAGICDLTEKCTGSSASCPSDVFKPSTTVCRASAGICDLTEKCTGSSVTCPADSYEPSSTVCRAAVVASDGTTCDVAEKCPGNAPQCPGDSFEPAMKVCRKSTFPCDPKEKCPGNSPACPKDKNNC